MHCAKNHRQHRTAPARLWRFSLAFYSRPGVAEALIALQDCAGCRRQSDAVCGVAAAVRHGHASMEGARRCRARRSRRSAARWWRRCGSCAAGSRPAPDADVQRLRDGSRHWNLAAEGSVATASGADLAAPDVAAARNARIAAARANLALCLGAEAAAARQRQVPALADSPNCWRLPTWLGAVLGGGPGASGDRPCPGFGAARPSAVRSRNRAQRGRGRGPGSGRPSRRSSAAWRRRPGPAARSSRPFPTSAVIVRRWPAWSGVSRTSSTSGRRSFRVTSAARLSSVVVTPLAISAMLRIEHGATTMPIVLNEPEEIGAARSPIACTTSARAAQPPPASARFRGPG